MSKKYYSLASNYKFAVKDDSVKYDGVPVRAITIWYGMFLGTEKQNLLFYQAHRKTNTDKDKIGLFHKNNNLFLPVKHLDKSKKDKFLEMYKQLFAAISVSYSSQIGVRINKDSDKIQKLLKAMSQLIGIDLEVRVDSYATGIDTDDNSELIPIYLGKDMLKQNKEMFDTKDNRSVKVHAIESVQYAK